MFCDQKMMHETMQDTYTLITDSYNFIINVRIIESIGD